jgi:hypothetical protein
MDKLLEKYNILFIKLEKLNKDNDNESSHILQDKIYRKFIKDICNNKFKTLDDIIKVANYMNKIVVKNDINRWYV